MRNETYFQKLAVACSWAARPGQEDIFLGVELDRRLIVGVELGEDFTLPKGIVVVQRIGNAAAQIGRLKQAQ